MDWKRQLEAGNWKLATDMDTILIVITALALAMAAGLAVVVATMLRNERARHAARVEALSVLAGEPGGVQFEAAPPAFAAPRWTTGSSRVEDPIVMREPAFRADNELEIRPAVAGVSNLFAEPELESPWGRRFVVIGGVAAIILAVGLTLTAVHSRNEPAQASAVPQTAVKPDVTPLELLSLKHTQESDRIVITGIVQNPRTAAPIAHVEASVFVFGPNGAFLSSSRAPLDFTTLTPGAESQFVVTVPVSGQVARYRVGFRTEDGHVLPHVDRRAPDALAQK
jgi:flagellar basal body-associated protein FliL